MQPPEHLPYHPTYIVDEYLGVDYREVDFDYRQINHIMRTMRWSQQEIMDRTIHISADEPSVPGRIGEYDAAKKTTYLYPYEVLAKYDDEYDEEYSDLAPWQARKADIDQITNALSSTLENLLCYQTIELGYSTPAIERQREKLVDRRLLALVGGSALAAGEVFAAGQVGFLDSTIQTVATLAAAGGIITYCSMLEANHRSDIEHNIYQLTRKPILEVQSQATGPLIHLS